MTIVGGLALRLLIAWTPILHDQLTHRAWCSPAKGLIGTCDIRNGRCRWCKRPAKPKP